MPHPNTVRVIASLCIALLVHAAVTSSVTRATRQNEPLITRTSSPTSTPTGVIGWRTIHGQVLNAAATPQPISSAQISLQHSSHHTASSQMTVTTDISGLFIFDSVFIWDTDQVRIRVEASGYTAQEETRGGTPLHSNVAFNFTLLWSNLFHLPIILR